MREEESPLEHMPPARDRFFGVWKLRTGDSLYEHGDVPRAGSYTILRDGDKIKFMIDAVLPTGRKMLVHYSVPPDGADHAYTQVPGIDSLRASFEGDCLISVSIKGGAEVERWTRELLSDGRMKITVWGSRPDGSSFRNVSYYEKVG
jgi:hypothetical protein